MLYRSFNAAHQAVNSGWRWPHFSISELSCRCGGEFCEGEYWHAPDFLDALQALRRKIGKPLQLTSAHRCPQWNAYVGGAPLSQHKQLAVDIHLRAHDRFALLQNAKLLGFSGLGLARTFLHLDRRSTPAVWYYSGSETLWQTS